MSKYFVVLVGGGLGAVARFALGTVVARFYSGTFPAGTFLINVTGSFLIGVLMTLFLNRPTLNASWRLFVVTGILGGYTTFSSFEWEALMTLRTGAAAISLLYIGSSVVLGLGAAWVGFILANKLWPH
jgi:fluoride exporter